MKLTFFPLALAVTLTFGAACLAQNPPPPAPGQAAPPPSTPAAAPPADPYAKILGPEVKVLGYGLRPPKDYTYAAQPLPTQGSRRRDFAWQGALHQDGYVTTLAVGITRLSAQEPNAEGEFMIGIFKGLSKTLTETVMSPSQPGTIGGLPARRATWTGKLVTTHSRLNIQGFVYVVQDGSILISIAGTDSAPYFTTTFPILNAAALSLHK